jgi:hypothetical protein
VTSNKAGRDGDEGAEEERRAGEFGGEFKDGSEASSLVDAEVRRNWSMGPLRPFFEDRLLGDELELELSRRLCFFVMVVARRKS